MQDLSHISRTINGVHFHTPILLAAGILKTAEDMEWAFKNNILGVWGSIQIDASPGKGISNKARVYHSQYQFVEGRPPVLMNSQNNIGGKNPGMNHVEEHASELLRMYDAAGFPLILSVMGRSVEEVFDLVRRAVRCGIRNLIVNGSCPHLGGKSMLCENGEWVDELFDLVEKHIDPKPTLLLWKVSTGMSRELLKYNADKVARSPAFTGIITGNTYQYGLNFNERGETTILTKDGEIHGGVGGPAIELMSLADTYFCVQRMPLGKIVVRCGGIRDGLSAIKSDWAGASLMKLHTAARESNQNGGLLDPDFIHRLIEDYTELKRGNIKRLR